MWGNPTLFYWPKSIKINIEKRFILTQSIEKDVLIDLLTTNNAIDRDLLTLIN